jgi:hypothetical protein
MEQGYAANADNGEKAYTVKNYCVNTNRTYIYEIRNGEIVNERKVHGEG